MPSPEHAIPQILNIMMVKQLTFKNLETTHPKKQHRKRLLGPLVNNVAAGLMAEHMYIVK